MSKVSFTVEEVNLLAIFQKTSKASMVRELREMEAEIKDPEMKEIMKSAISKLEQVTEEEFASLEFFPADYEKDDMISRNPD
jgi:BMFP domain-containing protein YqiC